MFLWTTSSLPLQFLPVSGESVIVRQQSPSNNWHGRAMLKETDARLPRAALADFPPRTLGLWKASSAVLLPCRRRRRVHLGRAFAFQLPGVTALKRASVSGPKSSHINHRRTNVLLNGCSDPQPPPESPSAARARIDSRQRELVSIASAVAGRSATDDTSAARNDHLCRANERLRHM